MDRALDRAMGGAFSWNHSKYTIWGLGKIWRLMKDHEKANSNTIKIYPWYTNWRDIIKYVEDYGPGDDWLVGMVLKE